MRLFFVIVNAVLLVSTKHQTQTPFNPVQLYTHLVSMQPPPPPLPVQYDRYPFQVPPPERTEEDEDDYEIPDAAKYAQDEPDPAEVKPAANKH